MLFIIIFVIQFSKTSKNRVKQGAEWVVYKRLTTFKTKQILLYLRSTTKRISNKIFSVLYFKIIL